MLTNPVAAVAVSLIDAYIERGGPGSGNWGHKGRKGKRGGSARGGVVGLPQEAFKTSAEQTTRQVRKGAAKRLAARWEVSRNDLGALMREEGLEFDGSEGAIKEQVTHDLLRTWAGSAGGPIPTSMAVSMCDKLGVEYKLTQRAADTTQYIKDRPAVQRAVSSLADAMYSGTQEWLKERNITSVELLRSGTLGKDRPHTSWSTDWGGVRHQRGRKVVTETIPARYILSVPSTGFGTLAESEVVVLARP